MQLEKTRAGQSHLPREDTKASVGPGGKVAGEYGPQFHLGRVGEQLQSSWKREGLLDLCSLSATACKY